MVFFTPCLLSGKNASRKFIDKLRIYVKGGNGGLGLSKYGGIGGRGGHVYAIGAENVSLKKIKHVNPDKRFVAGNGGNSSMRSLQGPPGEDVVIECPIGITVKTDSDITLGEILKEKDKVLLARGGRGGDPSNSFVGLKGDCHSVSLDLKLIADIGLVGFPNAGKSTLLKCLSRASPKIASYPFTTIEPRVGILEYEDHRQISMADLPGLIEGAHMNVGMGHKFLKHVERTKLLLLIVDVMGFRLNPKAPLRTSFENVLLLNKELELYKEELVSKPSILIINKVDLPDSHKHVDDLMRKIQHMEDELKTIEKEYRPNRLLRFDDVITISAKKSVNTDHLKRKLQELLDLHDDLEHESRSSIDKQLTSLKHSMVEHIGLGAV